MTRRPRILVVAMALAAAAVTLQAQDMTVNQASAQHERARTAFADAHYEDAYKQYNKVFSASRGETAARALKGMIRSALRLSSFQRARQEAEALNATTHDAEAVTLLGDAQWGIGLFDEAEATYRAARERFPDSARARFGIARSLATRLRLEDALTEALAASQASPTDPEILVLVAELYERLYKYDDAARVFAEYVKLLPSRLRNDPETAGIKIKLLRSFSGVTPALIDAAGGLDRPHVVPFTMRERKVVVQAVLNGKPMEIVVDTGADRTAITQYTASRAGIRGIVETMITGVGAPGVKSLSVGRASSLTIGDLTIRNLPVSIRRGNMPGTQNWQNETFSPTMVGLSVIVDYRRRELTLGRVLPVEPADFTLPLRVYRLPFVRGRVNDKFPASFVVDTGGEMLSISKDMATQLAMRPPRHIAIRVFGIMGLDKDAFVLPGVNLNFDEIQYRNFGVAVLNLRAPSVLLGFQVGGILGYSFLKDYRVSVDLTRGELRLSKAANP
jgi:predicted aspartyl protease